MTTRRYTIVDVFTDAPLRGNAAAVFTDAAGLITELMQRTARELNLSETVFVLPPEGTGDASLRIFTPGTELPFAGHPVLGAAFVLGANSHSERITFETGAGMVPVAFTRHDGRIAHAEMDQPIPALESFTRADELLAALGVTRSELPIDAYRNGPVHVFVALPDEAAVSRLRPNLVGLSDLGQEFGVSCFAGGGTRFKTRMFAPALGVGEDPATGSAAGPLALHLARHGRIDYGQRIEIRQGDEIHRPSLLFATVEGSPTQTSRVAVGGSAVIVAEGSYRLE
jgi:trans-2,3-dihydro-3-hydroxyanthranilate isomerase